MSKQIEALKLALEAFEADASNENFLILKHRVREALAEQPAQKTCLVANESCKHGSWCSEVYCQEHCKFAQPAQEPVAWMTPTGALYRTEDVDGCFDDKHIPLYTTPPHRKPLTMQERTSIVRANKSFHDKNEIDAYGIIDDVEAAHGIKE